VERKSSGLNGCGAGAAWTNCYCHDLKNTLTAKKPSNKTANAMQVIIKNKGKNQYK
jgi:hypothetical protein